MKNRGFFSWFFARYVFRLFIVFVLNAVTAVISLFSFMMIEPFLKLLFSGSLEGLSPVSNFVVSLISRNFSFDSLKGSYFVLIFAAIILFFLKNLFQYLSQSTMAFVRSNLTYTLRQSMYDKVISMPLSFFNKEKRGDFISRSVNDVQEAEYTVLTAIYQWFTDPVTLVLYLVFLFYLDYQLTLWSLLLLPPSLLLIGWLSHSLRKDSRTAKQRLSALTSFVEETMAGYKVIAMFGRQEPFHKRYDDINRSFHDKQRKIYRKSYLASPLSEFLGVTVVMVVLVIGGTLVLSERSPLSAELFITYIAVFSQTINPVKNISSAFAEFRRGQAAIERVTTFLSEEEETDENKSSSLVPEFNESIVFDDVSFVYSDAPDVPVLCNLSFTLKRGQTIAFVGESGSGKTTISNLLMRFFDPVAGCVKLDGVDVRSFGKASYRSLFALVSQEVMVFHDTFSNNITLGKDVSHEEVVAAAKAAGIHDFIMSFPEGYDHCLGDMGGTISGGQRQKVSIARAVLRKVPVFILDEATSAMDTESERAMQSSIHSLLKDCTKVVIAHRLSTIADADCIYVLQDGAVVESGTHEELLALRGQYYKLLTIQN